MNIRNTRVYINEITGGQPIGKIGTPSDPLYQKVIKAQSLEAHVGPLTKFAINSGVQLFYELLQNAQDAQADRLFFFLSERYLIVVNNGKPLQTNFNARSEEIPKGELFSFISAGDKYGEEGSIGKFGQGSKLLYNMIIPHREGNDLERATEDKLIRAIIQEKKGPIIYSWSSLSQLEILFNSKPNEIDTSESCNNEHPLFFKILYAYHPVYPGEEVVDKEGNSTIGFSAEEVRKLIDALQDIRVKFEKIHCNEGLMILIPLGNGQYEEINNKLENTIIPGIRSSLPFISKLEKVIFNDFDIRRSNYIKKEITPIVEEEREIKIDIAFPSNLEGYQEPIANFYQYFPISNTVFGLNFIINTEAYEIDRSRQNLDLSIQRNTQVLQRISEGLIAYLKTLVSQPDRLSEYIQFIKCVLFANISPLSQNNLIKELFDENLITFIKSNLPDQNGNISDKNIIIAKKSELNIPISHLIDANFKFLHPELNVHSALISQRLNVPVWSISQILINTTNRNALANWIHQLDLISYQSLLSEIENEHNTFSGLSKVPFVKISDGSVQSLEEINNNRIFLSMPYSKTLEPILTRLEINFGLNILEAFPKMFEMIQRQSGFKPETFLSRLITKFNESDLHPDEKWAVFEVYNSQDETKHFLESDLMIFCNQFGEKRPLNRLYYHALSDAPSGLLANYNLRASENYFQYLKPWLLNRSNIWPVIIAEWSEEVDQQLVADQFEQIIIDLSNLYKHATIKTKLPNEIPWILNDEGQWVSEGVTFFDDRMFDQIKNEADYMEIVSFIRTATNFSIVEYSHAILINDIQWINWRTCGLQSIKNRWKEGERPISKKQIELLKNLHTPDESFFLLFTLREEEGQYYLDVNENSKQYYIQDAQASDFLNHQRSYFKLPGSLVNIFSERDGLLLESDNFIKNLILEFRSRPEFIDMVLRRSQETKLLYLQNTDYINLHSNKGPEEYRNTYEGKILQLIVREEWSKNFREIINIDDQPLTSYTYHNRVKLSFDYENNHFDLKFDLADLLEEMRGSSDVIQMIKDKCTGLGVTSLFDLEDYPEEDIYHKLKNRKISNPEQISFIVAYSTTFQQLDWDDFDLSDSIHPKSVLNSLYKHNLYFYNFIDSDLPFEELTFYKLIHSQQNNLLIPQEHTVNWLEEWIQQNQSDKKRSFLKNAGLKFDNDAVILFRLGINQNKILSDEIISAVAGWQYNAYNSIKWIHNDNNTHFSRNDPKFSNLQRLIAYFYKYQKDIPDILININPSEDLHFTLSSIDQNDAMGFVDSDVSNEFSIWKDAISQEKIVIFDFSHSITDSSIEDVLKKYNINRCTLKSELNADKIIQLEEWENRHYEQWKTKNSNIFKIFLLTQNVPLNYYLNYDGESILIGTYNKGEAERLTKHEGVHLYIYAEPKTHQRIIEILNHYKEYLFITASEKDLFIDFLSSLIQEIPESKKPSDGTGEGIIPPVPVTKDQKSAIINNFESIIKIVENKTQSEVNKIVNNLDIINNLTDKSLKRLKENIKTINQLLEKADGNLLKLMLENLDSIRLELEKEKPDPKPIALIGYIGERLTWLWLNKHGRNAQYVGDHVWEYDIEFERNNRIIKIDVKTTIKSILNEEDSIPFYIKKSQFRYIKNNPEVHYYGSTPNSVGFHIFTAWMNYQFSQQHWV